MLVYVAMKENKIFIWLIYNGAIMETQEWVKQRMYKFREHLFGKSCQLRTKQSRFYDFKSSLFCQISVS